MKRRLANLLTLLTLLSLILCLLAASLWVRSVWLPGTWRLWSGQNSTWFLVSISGTLRLVEQGINPVDPSSYKSVDSSTFGAMSIYSLRSHQGTIGIVQFPVLPPPGHRFAGFELTIGDRGSSASRAGPSTRSVLPFGLRYRAVAIPYWFWMLITALLPVFWLRRRRQQRQRLRQGLCPHCGYDLRATPDRCPECGAPAPCPPGS